jgi:hypothetical protein
LPTAVSRSAVCMLLQFSQPLSLPASCSSHKRPAGVLGKSGRFDQRALGWSRSGNRTEEGELRQVARLLQATFHAAYTRLWPILCNTVLGQEKSIEEEYEVRTRRQWRRPARTGSITWCRRSRS